MKKILILLALLALPFTASAQIFKVQQLVLPPYAGVLMSTSTNGNSFAVASTSPTVGSITATSTNLTSYFGGIVRIVGNFFLPSLSQGSLYIGSSGTVGTTATTSVTCSGTVSCTGFNVFGSSPVTITGSGGGSGNVSTSTNETAGRIAYWTSNSGTPALLGEVATTSLAVSSPLTVTGTLGALVGGTNSTINCQAASTVQSGCLSDTNFNVFNNKLGSYNAWPLLQNSTRSGTSTLILLYGNASSTGFSANYAQFGATATTTLTLDGKLGVGTTSPAARLSIDSIAGDAFSLWVGSTTAPWLRVSNSGFGTTTLSGLSISGSATSTSSVGFNITTGCYAVAGTCLSAGGSGDITSVGDVASGAAFDGTQGTVLTFNGAVDGTINYDGTMFEISKATDIGTTTGNTMLNLASSTTSQLALSAGAGASEWWLRSAGGALYFATSTGVATSTNAISFQSASATSGGLLIGTSTPGSTGLAVNGTVFLHGLTAATGGTNSTLCISATPNQVIEESTTVCAASSRKFKKDIKKLDFSALEKVLKLNPTYFSMKEDVSYDYKNIQYGFIAEEVAEVDPHLAEYGNDGLPRNLDDRAILSVAVKAIQEISSKGVEAKRSAEEDWQNALIGALFLMIIGQQYQIRKLKK